MENAKGYPFSEEERLRHRAKWEDANAESIVRKMRQQIAKSQIEPGDRRRWHNLQMVTTVSAVALGKANDYAAR